MVEVPVLDRHRRTDESNGPDGNADPHFGMGLEDRREGSLDRLSALGGVSLFVDQLAAGDKKSRQRLGVVDIRRLGEGVDVASNRIFVVRAGWFGGGCLGVPRCRHNCRDQCGRHDYRCSHGWNLL